MISLAHARRVLLAALALAMLVPLSSYAQTTAPTSEIVTLSAGDIFEIAAVEHLSAPQFSWILTKDRTFLESGRGSVFHTRLTVEGTYALSADIVDQDGSRISRTFELTVLPHQPSAGETSSAGVVTSELLRTDPTSLTPGVLAIPPATQLVSLLPQSLDGPRLSVDLDTARDTDGNGDPAHDSDLRDTFFTSDRTPLRLWITDPSVPLHVNVFATRPDGGVQDQPLTILSTTTAIEQGLGEASIDIQATESPAGTMHFAGVFRGSAPLVPVLFHWDFGDGAQSLADAPVHAYTAKGTYGVTLKLQNLATGAEIASRQEEFVVTGGGVVTTSSSSSAAGTVATGGIVSWIWFLVKLLGIFLLMGAIGGGIVYLWKFLRRGKSLEEQLASMESTIVGDNGIAAPAPLTLTTPEEDAPKKAERIEKKISEREQEKDVTPPVIEAETPKIEEQHAPAWLKKGLAAAEEQEPQREAPPAATQKMPPEMLQKKPEPPPAIPEPAPKPTEPALTSVEPTMRETPKKESARPALPAWLTPAAPTPAPMPAPPTPKPQPPRPAPQPKKPISAPPPKPAPLPPPKPAALARTPTPPKPPSAPPAPALPTPTAPPAIPSASSTPTAPSVPSPIPPAIQDVPPTEEPIAFIRAESLEKKQPPQTPPAQ